MQKGDYIHFAFPASVAQSFVCVCLHFWDEPPVSVHLEYFASLNLELDGDEMHVSIMTEKRCEDEAEANIRLNTLSKFILDKLARAFRESGFDGSALNARCVGFMTLPTLNADRDADRVQMKPIYHLFCFNLAQCIGLSSHHCSRRLRMETFVQKCTDSVHDLTKSHIRVSNRLYRGSAPQALLVPDGNYSS